MNETKGSGVELRCNTHTHLESLRVFVYLAGGFVVIERVPEDQTQIFVDF